MKIQGDFNACAVGPTLILPTADADTASPPVEDPALGPLAATEDIALDPTTAPQPVAKLAKALEEGVPRESSQETQKVFCIIFLNCLIILNSICDLITIS